MPTRRRCWLMLVLHNHVSADPASIQIYSISRNALVTHDA
jgi:hypothetical protein